MLNNDDFFSPEGLDERLELARQLQTAGLERQRIESSESHAQLLARLQDLYRAESIRDAQSVQRVWERLATQHIDVPLLEEPALDAGKLHLHVVKPVYKSTSEATKREARRPSTRTLVALVASFFILVMVGGMLMVYQTLPGVGRIHMGTPGAKPSSALAAPIPGYPLPGRKLATTPASWDAFYVLAWSPDGKRLAMVTRNEVWIWEMATGRYTLVVQPEKLAVEPIRALAWSADGRYLAVGTNPVQVIDPVTYRVLFNFPVYAFWPTTSYDYQAAITALAWSPDSRRLAIAALRFGNGCVVQLRDVRQSTLLMNSYPCGSSSTGVSALSWSSDAADLASTDDRMVQAWDVATGSTIFQQPVQNSTVVVWSPTRPDQLAFIDNNRALVWDVGMNFLVSQYAVTGESALTWSPDGLYLAVVNGGKVVIWQAVGGKHLFTYSATAHVIHTLAWSPDGGELAAGEGDQSAQNRVYVWST